MDGYDEIPYRGPGSPYERGWADACHGRPYRPHCFLGASYFSEGEGEYTTDLTDAQLAEYRKGYEWEQDRRCRLDDEARRRAQAEGRDRGN